MGSLNRSPISLLSILVLLLVIIQSDSTLVQEDYVGCLHCQSLLSTSNIIYTPKNPSYLSILQSSEQNLRPASISPLKPILILTPRHGSQIQAAVYCAKKYGIQIRVRSGGHDYEGLSYISSIPFVIVDLRNLSKISVDTKKHTAWVQAGATLGELYHKIAEKSRTLAFVAGTCPTVGVGGHISGGGYGMMSRKFGMAVDQVVDAKIIDVNGQILDRESMGEDLFWAIRGGGGASFGIIIAWKINLLSVPENVTVFNLTKTLDQNATQLLHKWQYIADNINRNLLIRPTVTMTNSSENGKRTIQVTFNSLFLGGVDELLPVMQRSFPELGLEKEDCTEVSWIESILYFSDYHIGGSVDVLLSRTPLGRAYFKGKSDFVKQPISENGLKGIWEILLEEMGVVEVQLSPYGGRLSEISESATPFPHRSGNIYMIHYVVAWGGEDANAESRKHINWIRRLSSYLASYVSESPRAAYINYRDLDLGVNSEGNPSYNQASNWGAKYFKNNFERLVRVKTKVDPSNFFRNEQSIPPLSSSDLLFRWKL
ncbi:hypothetical protein ACH5RR_032712 [Cinchona calisaya]|uniref:FAD-binding PCMH-type domain-containing protein n=1 Tax=Cinchona calisaya TaxID=153742 RepID=A0ABD2YMF1_9GENT